MPSGRAALRRLRRLLRAQESKSCVVQGKDATVSYSIFNVGKGCASDLAPRCIVSSRLKLESACIGTARRRSALRLLSVHTLLLRSRRGESESGRGVRAQILTGRLRCVRTGSTAYDVKLTDASLEGDFGLVEPVALKFAKIGACVIMWTPSLFPLRHGTGGSRARVRVGVCVRRRGGAVDSQRVCVREHSRELLARIPHCEFAWCQRLPRSPPF